MGKATILENMGAGRYRIKVYFDNAQVDALLAYNESIIITLNTQIADNAIKKAEALDDYQYHLRYLTAFIVDAGPEGIIDRQDEVQHAMGTVTRKKAAYDEAVHTEALSKLRLQKATKEIDYLTKYCPKEIEAYAWCVAYNEDLTGDLASIEVDYVLHRDLYTQQIRDHTGFWLFESPTVPSNILQHPLSTSEHANWFNLCMAPSAQRHKGLYRIAVIIRIDYDLNECDLGFVGYYDVDRFAQERYIRDMPIHPNFDVYGAQQVEYRGAKIEYMGGGSETFLVEDRVIVDLHAGVGVPTVIGYYENPRQGSKAYLLATVNEDFPQHWINDGHDVIDLYGFCVLRDMVENADKYTISFGIGSHVATADANGVWGNAFNMLWFDGNSSINIINNTLINPGTGGRTQTDYLYFINTGVENVKKYAEMHVYLDNQSEITIFKEGIEYAHIKFYPQGSGLGVKTAFIVDQSGTPIFSELKDSAVKGYFKFTGSYVKDWSS